MRKTVRNGIPRGRSEGFGPLACILGTGVIASAVACALARAGWSVVLSHDPAAAVLRRRAAFYDVLFGEEVCLDGVCGHYAGRGADIRRVLAAYPGDVAVTPLDLMGVIVLGSLDLLIDARAEAGLRPDLRHLAGVGIGIGPNWYGGVNCDFAIPMPQPCARQGLRIPAPVSGYWYSGIAPGMRVKAHAVLGKVGGYSVRAPCDGLVTGILRSGLRLSVGVPLADLSFNLHARANGGGMGAGEIAAEVLTLALAQMRTQVHESGTAFDYAVATAFRIS